MLPIASEKVNVPENFHKRCKISVFKCIHGVLYTAVKSLFSYYEYGVLFSYSLILTQEYSPKQVLPVCSNVYISESSHFQVYVAKNYKLGLSKVYKEFSALVVENTDILNI